MTPARPDTTVSSTVTRAPSAKAWALPPMGSGASATRRASNHNSTIMPTTATPMVAFAALLAAPRGRPGTAEKGHHLQRMSSLNHFFEIAAYVPSASTAASALFTSPARPTLPLLTAAAIFSVKMKSPSFSGRARRGRERGLADELVGDPRVDVAGLQRGARRVVLREVLHVLDGQLPGRVVVRRAGLHGHDLAGEILGRLDGTVPGDDHAAGCSSAGRRR